MKKPPTHVLLIEDNPGDADLVRLRLVEGNSGVDVACADRLSTGLDSLSKEEPALVLLDLNLPDSRGAETFRNVLKNAPGVPVVVLSGQDDEELALKAVHQGVQDYLVKGAFDSKQLARAMRYAIERQALLTSLDLSRKQQLQFKDQFLSHVSHELRTPLTCIHQFVTILLDGLAGTLSVEQREHLGTVMRSVNQLQSMIGHLLEAARAETGKIRIEPRCLLVDSLIRQAVNMMQASAQSKQIKLDVSVCGALGLVYADPGRGLQILINLIDNAVKFTPAGGSITVKAFSVEADPQFVYLSVVDTGQGISPEAKALIFERMYQDPNALDNSRKGLGLGLFIVQELVRLQGGRIWVESQLSQGSTFSFTLPVFSLAKLLTPVVSDQGRLRDSLTLVIVSATPRGTPEMGNPEHVHQLCTELLRNCILPAKDLLMPALATSGQKENFLIVASTDAEGAQVLAKRIIDQFERSPELASSATFAVSTIPLTLPGVEAAMPLEAQVRAIAAMVTEFATQSLRTQTGRRGNGAVSS